MKKLLIALTALLVFTGCTSKEPKIDPADEKQIAMWETDRETFAGTAYGDHYNLLDEGYTFQHVGPEHTFIHNGMTFTPTSFDTSEKGSRVTYDVDAVSVEEFENYHRLKMIGYNHEGDININAENEFTLDPYGPEDEFSPGTFTINISKRHTRTLPSAVMFFEDEANKSATILHLELHDEPVEETVEISALEQWYIDAGVSEEEMVDLEIGDTFMYAGLKHTLKGYDNSQNKDDKYVAIFDVINETDENIDPTYIVPQSFDGAGENTALSQLKGGTPFAYETGKLERDVRYGFSISNVEAAARDKAPSEPGTYSMMFSPYEGGKAYRIKVEVPVIHGDN